MDCDVIIKTTHALLLHWPLLLGRCLHLFTHHNIRFIVMVNMFKEFLLVDSNVLCSIQLIYVNVDVLWLGCGDIDQTNLQN